MNRIKNFRQLNTTAEREIVLELIEAALAAIDPEDVFKAHFKVNGKILIVREKKIDLAGFDRIFLLGFGKGSAKNCAIIERILDSKLTGGFVIDVTSEKFTKIQFSLGTHPLPSRQNVEFAQKVADAFCDLSEKDLVIVVTCGGGSALFELPTIPLDSLRKIDQELLHSGANIHDVNVVRKHLSRVKGGGLAEIVFPATIINLVFSDVPGNDLTVIASGPTVADPTSQEDAWQTYNQYNLEDKDHLKKSDFTKTIDDKKIFENVDNILFLSNLTALSAMKQKAKELGIEASIFSDRFQGEAKDAGQKLIKNTKNGQILLTGGETTVKVIGDGAGGRNLEVVLGALDSLNNKTIIASFASDGWDNNEYAGAIGDNQTVVGLRNLNLDPQVFLNRNDSLNFFRNVGGGIETGRLPSNVSDLMIVYKP